MEALDQIMEALFTPYRQRVPDVGKIVNAMQTKGMIAQESEIENDHVAFRTLGVPHLGIASFEKIFCIMVTQKCRLTFLKRKS